MFGEWVVFNDPDDDEYDEDEEPLAFRYMDESIMDEYFVFRNVANGNPDTYANLYYSMSRLDLFRIYAMNLTFIKEKSKARERQSGK
jgi:hypothetical protein